MIVSKYYKPEILSCPKCKSKLIYRYAISNKIVYYLNGKQVKIHNLGYSCPTCVDGRIYASQTANKIALRGYTYSTKIMCMIAKLKESHKSREEICDFFYNKGIEISDRNVDNLYKKIKACYEIDYNEKISKAYEWMLQEYNQIRLSIDYITICKSVFIIVYNYFSFEMLAFKHFNNLDDPEILQFLASFLKSDLNITLIVSIRKDANFIPLLKRFCPEKTKVIPFTKN